MDNVDHEGDNMHSDPKNDDMIASTSGNKRKRNEPTKRGIVTMNKVIEARNKGIKIKVEFNRGGQPIGANKSTFAYYIGYVARTMVPLTVINWRYVPNTLRQVIWEDIQQCFEVEEWNMNVTLKKVGKAAKEFRSKMAKMCFDDEGNPMLCPPEKYAQFPIVRDHWMDFVNACGHRKFLVTNSKIAKKRKFLYKKGALGYAQFRENMDFIAETSTNEEMMYRGPDDVLAKALTHSSMKEYHERVLITGSSVTMKNYSRKRREESSDTELHQMKEGIVEMQKEIAELEDKFKVSQEVDDLEITPVRCSNANQMNEVLVKMQKRIAKVKAKCKVLREDHDLENTPVRDPPIERSEQGSCSDANQIPEGESICDLFVESPAYMKVGWGLVYKEEGQKVSNVILKSNEVKVCLKEVFMGRENTLLPIQNAATDISTVGEAKGTYVVWPLLLVSLQNKGFVLRSKGQSAVQSVTPKRPAYPRPGDFDSTTCRHICKFYSKHSNAKAISVPMYDAFWNAAFTDQIGLENIQEVLQLGWLSASSIGLYIRYLCDALLIHEEGGVQSNSSKYSFTSPHVTKGHTHIVNALQKHADQDHLIIIPYNLEHHWLLVAINAKTEYVYYMDPLRVHHSKPERVKLEYTIKSALSDYRANIQGSSGGRSKTITNVQWYDIQCPKQNLEKGYCAFYICLFIEDILESEATNVPGTYFKKRCCDTFSDDRIEHVQKEWCGYFFNRFLNDTLE